MAFWVVVMGLMFAGPGETDAVVLSGGDLSAGFSEGEEWMGAYHAGRKLGYVHSTTRREAGRLVLTQKSRLEIGLGGSRQEIVTGLRVTLGTGFHLERFEFDLQTGILDVRASGEMQGRRLVVRMSAGGESVRRMWTLEEPPLFDLAIPKLLAQHDLRPGRRFQVTLFDPRTLSNRPARIEVVGREPVSVKGRLVPAVRIKRSGAGMGTESWISERGEVLKQEHEIGLTLLREDPDQARRPGRPEDKTPAAESILRRLVPDGRMMENGENRESEDAGP